MLQFTQTRKSVKTDLIIILKILADGLQKQIIFSPNTEKKLKVDHWFFDFDVRKQCCCR